MPRTTRVLLCYSFALVTLLLAGRLCLAEPAGPSGLSGVGALTSQYIYRGQAMSDGELALQFGLDYTHASGVFGGVWASTIDLQSYVGQRDTELDYYIGYHHEASALTFTLLRYTYPGQTGLYSYDYNEALVSISLTERYSLELGYTNDFYGLGRAARHWEMRSDWPIASAWLISAGLGGNDLSDAGASHYLHWDLGLSVRFSRLLVDLRWYDNQTPAGFAATLSADSQFVISLSAPF